MSASHEGGCRLCGKSAALVRSHIIPRSFFDIDSDGTTLFSNGPGKLPRRAPVGVYDRIICSDCEDSFSLYDDYAFRTLKRDLPSYERVYHQGQFAGLVARNPDFRLLKMFVISLLWRASVTTHDFYKR